MDVLLVGTGRMARAYAAVLKAQGIATTALGRSEDHAKAFSAETDIPATGGGVDFWKQDAQLIPTHAILAIDVAEIAGVATALIEAGVRSLLLEKPGALTAEALAPLIALAKERGARISIGYNRRYLASTQKAREVIAEDGGATSFYFEFNELTSQKQRIPALSTPQKTVERWFIANSTHVIDLAFYLGGEPRALTGFSAAGPLWAPHPTLFSGAGIASEGIPFSYFANWEIDGPWLVEVQTRKRKVVLQPLEKLRSEENGAWSDVAFENALDTKFRPGLYREVAFFLQQPDALPTLEHQIERFDWYERMLRGTMIQ